MKEWRNITRSESDFPYVPHMNMFQLSRKEKHERWQLWSHMPQNSLFYILNSITQHHIF